MAGERSISIREEAISGLPASRIASQVNDSLASKPRLVLTAPPGAGKSTLLPLTILQEAGPGKILMLEPRRLAARQIAERMSHLIGEEVGRTVGYRVRFENRTSSATRIEVLTEGILTRMMAEDQTLDGISTLIFDEFHERSIISDSALALALETQKLVRPDLRIVIMSATIDAEAICSAIDAPLLESEGRLFPIETIHCPDITDARECPETVAHVIRQAHKEHEGDILAFLPGEWEIRRCAELLGTSLGATSIYPLYGMLPPEEQRKAIAPSRPGERKVVLATPVAETSITIEGVRVVVDSGLCRKMVFNQQSGLSRMETFQISMDMADQRRGRAGRVAPGICYRLWTLGTESRMQACRKPEIEEADLVPMVLDLASWGTDARSLEWLTPPSEARISQAEALLKALGALDGRGITAHGRKLASLPCHPRIAQMLLRAGTDSGKALATDIAALIEEKDPMPEAGTDLCLRIAELRRMRERDRIERGWMRIAQNTAQYRRLMHIDIDNSTPDSFEAGALTASAFPEKVAKAHADGCGRFILATGDTVQMELSDALSSEEWIAVANVNPRRDGGGRIFLAAPLSPDDVPELMTERDNVSWDSRRGCVVMRREKNIGCLNVSSKPIHDVPREKVDALICKAVQKEGLSMLDFSDTVSALQQRVATVASWHPELELPDLSTEAVLSEAQDWLPLYLGKATSAEEMKKIDLCTALWSRLDYEQQKAVERIAPSHLVVPTGSHIRVEYRSGADAPVLRVRLQECFGLLDTPRVDEGRRPVLMELLSPGFKPVQLTSDLRSFWSGTYFEVRKELKRRYPKHSWPDDPLEAEAVRGVKKNK